MAIVHESRTLKLGFSHLEDGKSVKTSKRIGGVDPEATEANMKIAAVSVGELTKDSLLSKTFTDEFVIEEADD